jgi:hypothetical protein
MRLGWALLVLASCGRVGFDPLGGGGDGGPGAGDGTTGGSDTGGSETGDPVAGEDCASAVDLAIGSSGTETFTGVANDVAPLISFCPDGVEIVYRVTVGSTQDRMLHFKPTFDATLSTSSQCPPSGGGCQTVITNQTFDKSEQFQSGTNFIIIDKTGGQGTSFELGLQ